MKYLKYILAIVAILVLIFLIIGFIKPNVSYDSEIIVDKPLQESWMVTQDEDKMDEWLEGFQKVEHVSGTPGTVGAVSNVYFITEGQEMIIKETITSFTPNESMEMMFESDFMDMDYKLEMASVNGKTKISSTTNAKGNGVFSKSIMALMAGSLKTQEDTNMANLKKTIEANNTNYSTTADATNESTEN